MLTVLTLNTIDKIFKEQAQCKLSAMSQMLYINCLLHHFRDKPAKVSNAVAFELDEEDFGNFEKYKKNIVELEKASLVSRGIKTVVFLNLWSQYIDRTKLEKVKPDEYLMGFQMKTATQFKDELLNNKSMFELAQMKHKVSKGTVLQLLEIFVKEQDTLEKKYCNFPECISHFMNWIPKNADKAQNVAVKSTSKILGM